jgi:hypothetical protein
MTKPIISICASANRVQFWPRLLDSLKGNKTPYEVIFAGDKKPEFDMSKYPEFKWIHCTCKPAQAYQIAFWEAQGELVHWTADDADYHCVAKVLPDKEDCFNQLDRAYVCWQRMEERHNHDKKSIVAFRPIEDGGDVWRFHHFFGGWPETPPMAPFALVHRKYLSEPETGYDKYFVSGQSENDVIMRIFEDGGRLEVCMNAFIYVHHRQVHPRDPNTGKEDNKFRKWYNKDRERLENCWVIGGYGYYEKLNQFRNNSEETRKQIRISQKRLCPLEPFVKTEDVYAVSQGEKGHWQ